MPIFKTKNENFFKKWSPEMAYVLGFLCADGNLTAGRRGNKYIEFTSTDKDILEKIRKTLGSNHKIGCKKRRSGWKNCFRMQIGSKILFDDLTALGFKPNKSKRLVYPKIPNQYLTSFIRGYFDGDGHVTTGVYKRCDSKALKRILFSGFTCGTKNFLKQLKKDLAQNEIRGGTLYKQDSFYRLNFSSRNSLRLYKFLYKESGNGLYLTRKKRIFEKFRNRHAAVV